MRQTVGPIEDLKTLVAAARPEIVYTHNPTDRHETHVAVGLRVIEALRELPADFRPKHLYGVEDWRDLDWMVEEDKIYFDVSGHDNLAAALIEVFDSQHCGASGTTRRLPRGGGPTPCTQDRTRVTTNGRTSSTAWT